MLTDIDTDEAAAHRMFRSFDGMEGVPEVAAPAPATGLPGQALLTKVYPGRAGRR